MAKEGIGYFSLDTDFFHSDKKVKIIKGEFGAKGVVILIYTLCAIYSDKGYYMEWGNDDCYLMSDDLGCDCSPNLIGEVINRCVKRGIFNEEVFNAFGILTSHGIQIRFLKAAAKREKIKIIEEYALFDFEELKEGMRNKIAFFSMNVARKNEKVARKSEKVASCDTKKESKESKVNKRIMCTADADALFEHLWKLYPLKRGKGRISDAGKKRLLEIGFDEMSRAIDRYKAELEKDKDWRKPQNGSTFFTSGYVDYLDGNYVQGKQLAHTKKGFHSFRQNEYDFDALEKELIENQEGRNAERI